MFTELYTKPTYKEPIRARRRREKENAFRKAVKYIQQSYYYPIKADDIIAQAQRRANNFQVCSCHACGNPRRDWMSSSKKRLTIQERKAADDMKQQLYDLVDTISEVEREQQYKKRIELVNAWLSK